MLLLAYVDAIKAGSVKKKKGTMENRKKRGERVPVIV